MIVLRRGSGSTGDVQGSGWPIAGAGSCSKEILASAHKLGVLRYLVVDTSLTDKHKYFLLVHCLNQVFLSQSAPMQQRKLPSDHACMNVAVQPNHDNDKWSMHLSTQSTADRSSSKPALLVFGVCSDGKQDQSKVNLGRAMTTTDRQGQ